MIQPRRSCGFQVIVSYNDNSRLFNRRYVKQVDFAKAFNKVPQERRAQRLQFCGITGENLYWITDFLSNRSQSVLLGGTVSNLVPVSSGVPQGTVFGPLLFLLYLKDLPPSTLNSATRLSDDSLIYRPIKPPNDCKLLTLTPLSNGKPLIKWIPDPTDAKPRTSPVPNQPLNFFIQSTYDSCPTHHHTNNQESHYTPT